MLGDRYNTVMLKEDGSVSMWGETWDTVEAQLTSGVVSVCSTCPYGAGIYAALKTDGSVVEWGGWYNGLNTGPEMARVASGVVRLRALDHGFEAEKEDGATVVWV